MPSSIIRRPNTATPSSAASHKVSTSSMRSRPCAPARASSTRTHPSRMRASFPRDVSMPHRTSRLVKWITVAILAAILLPALPVLLLRAWHPYTSAFMLRARLEALAAHDTRYRPRYEWVDYAHISAWAALAVMASEDQQFPF